MASPYVDSASVPVLPADMAAVSRSSRRRLVLCLLVAFFGIVLSAFLSWLLWTREEKLTEVQFKLDAGKRVEALQRTVADRLSAVNTVAAFFAGSRLVDRKEFHTFSAPVLQKHPDTEMLAWVPRIPAAQRKSHEEAVRQEGLPTYEIRQRDDQGQFVTAGKRETYYPILFAEPSGKKSRSLIGLDVWANPTCRGAIQQAVATRRQTAVVSGALDGNEAGHYLLYVVEPAWNEDSEPLKRPADQPEIDGVVLGVFRIRAMAESSLDYFSPVGIDVRIATSSASGGETPVYTRLSPLHAEDKAQQPGSSAMMFFEGGVHFHGTVGVANTHWNVDCVPMASYLEKQQTWGPIGVLLVGLSITGLLVVLLHVITGQTARVGRLVTARTRALGESEQRFRRLVDNAGDAFFLCDEQGKILDVNKQTCESLGYTREELLSMAIADIDPQFISENRRRYAELPGEHYPVTLQGVQRRKDGGTFPVEIRMAVLDLAGQRLMISFARDITERKRAEEELHQEQLLLREMLDLHERERKVIAYEIHDGLSQQLTAALYKFQAIDRLCEHKPEEAGKLFEEAMRLLREAMAETRRLIGGLRPPVLDESGIVPAIDYLIAEHSRQGDPEIEFFQGADIGRLAPPLESALFRIVQECLTNACRHSHSKKVRVELRRTGDRMRVEVWDWGVGFDPAEVKGSHFGLQGIRERAKVLGGVAVIQAAPQQGVHVTVELPLVLQSEMGTIRRDHKPVDDRAQ